MKYNLFDLRKIDTPIVISSVVDFGVKEFKNADLKEISKVNVKGTLAKMNEEKYLVSLNLHTNLMMQCAVTLEDLSYPLKLSICEVYTENGSFEDDFIIIKDNEIDLRELIFEHIMLNIPMKLVKEGYLDYFDEKDSPKINEAFASLKDFLQDKNGGEE